MEYLTLQDIPHRQYDPLHSRRMASSQSTERPLGMADAVSEYRPSSTGHFRRSRSPRSLPSLIPSDFNLNLVQECPTKQCTSPCQQDHPSCPASATYHETQHVSGHHCSPNKHLCPSHNSTHHGSPYRPLPVLSLGTFSTYSTSRSTSHSFGTENVSEVSRGRAREYPFTRNSIEDEFRKYSIKLTRKQNRHMRNSPPFQPGEQAYPDKLPSFSEVCYLLVL
jgi:hypothetical protein